jgi:hypothetical protein
MNTKNVEEDKINEQIQTEQHLKSENINNNNIIINDNNDYDEKSKVKKPKNNKYNKVSNISNSPSNLISDRKTLYRIKTLKAPPNYNEQINIRNNDNFKRLKFWKSLIYAFCFKRYEIKQDQYFFEKNFLEERLDIAYYIKALTEMDMFKLFMLNCNYYQSLSSKYLKKFNLTDIEDQTMLNLYRNKHSNLEIGEMVKYFNNRRINNEMDNYDEYMFSMLDPIIKKDCEKKSLIN